MSKLLKDGYYSQSLLETFKALTFHLYKKLLDRGITVSTNRFEDIFKLSLREGLVKNEDISLIQHIRGVRNATAHTNVGTNENFAETALDFVRKLIERNK